MVEAIEEIICATDLDHESLSAECVAYDLAKKLGYKLRLVHVDSSLEQIKFYHTIANQYLKPALWEKLGGELMADKARKLRHRIHKIGAAADSNVTFDVIMGAPAKEILKLLKKSRSTVKMVVLSKRKRSFFSEYFLGAVAHEIIEQCAIPALLVPENSDLFSRWQPSRIVIGAGLRFGNRSISQIGQHLAESFAAELKFVHVMTDRISSGKSTFPDLKTTKTAEMESYFLTTENEVKRLLEQEVAQVARPLRQVETEILFGPAADLLMQDMQDREDDLLIIGSHIGLKNMQCELGSLAGTLARAARFPLLIIPMIQTIQEEGKV